MILQARRRLAHGSLDDGGCNFAHDPGRPAGPGPVFWLPEVSPGTIILDAAPDGFEPILALDISRLGSLAAEVTERDERELVVFGSPDELHIRLRTSSSERRPAVLLPIDANFELRLETALRFVRRLRGNPTKLLPSALRLTSMQKARLVRLLHAFDIHSAGGGPRDVAADVLSSKQAKLPSVEWKDSHSRRAANRLIHDSIALVERGYLKLLRGR
ncbi:DUF2285 domain-containing protein [Rhodopila sp.]|uniref:DUF2285 domain-containing protein n=1 Tax=Rhodopila sp. TaxID=2480087 RepID=UPI002B901A70|nr:DUF2285 domain-containing protein [Rhodopila sp.]HVZ06605.1 DUF2285 domain-containing protein [Rhodopila sp.]